MRERKADAWEGRSLVEFKEHCNNSLQLSSYSKQEFMTHKADAGIESYEEVYSRAHNVITKYVASHPHPTPLLFVSQGAVLHTILYSLDFRPDCLSDIQLINENDLAARP